MKLPLGHDQHALTVYDVIALLFVLCFVVGLFLPNLSHRRRNPRIQCLSSLKVVTLGFRLWANDNTDRGMPFRVPYEKGGLMNPGTNKINIPEMGQFDPILRSNAWMQYLVINQEVSSPKILVCPADKERKRASSWGSAPDGGFTHPSYRNQAVSYCIGLDPGKFSEESQKRVLLSERHMEYDAVDNLCSANVGLTKAIRITIRGGTNSVNVGWKNSRPRLHKDGGNIALMDGSAHQVNASQLKEFLAQSPSDNGSLHFIYP